MADARAGVKHPALATQGPELTARNPADPGGMPSDERLHEVIALLAAGFLRSRAARAVDGGEEYLDVLRTSSEVCHEPRSEGESL